MKNKLNCSYLIIFLFSLIAYGQTDSNKKALSELLTGLEKKYNCHFDYADDVIEGIFVEAVPDNYSIEEVIDYLRHIPGLNFEFQKNNHITINRINYNEYICGYVIDDETRNPVPDAMVIVGNSNSTTDSYGFFRLKSKEGEDSVIIESLGYITLVENSTSFESGNCKNLYLEPRIEILSEIILKSFLTININKVVDGSININFKKFDILPGLIEPDVLQTVQALPGVQSTNETVSNITIRGGTHDQNLILWDGIKMYQSGHFFGLISMFNPLITNDVTLIKNGTDAELTDGVSGTLYMHTNTAINKDFNASIGINFMSADIFGDIPLGKRSSIQVSGRKSIDQIAHTPTYNNYYDRILQDSEVTNGNDFQRSLNRFNFYDASARWLCDITDKDRLQFNFLLSSNQFDAEGESKESDLKQESIAEGLQYERKWKESFHSSLYIYETDYVLNAIKTDSNVNTITTDENRVSESTIKLNTTYKPNEYFSFLNGYQFTETGITNATTVDRPLFQNKIKRVLREHALYSQFNYSFNNNRTYIKAGLRYNYIEKFQKHLLEPRFSINQKLTDYLSVEILGEKKHQNTTQTINSQTDFLGIEKRRWWLSDNSNIPIITSKQVSVGLNFSKHNWLLSLDGFIKQVDGITSQSQNFLNQYKRAEETGLYKIYGIDFLINKKTKNLSSWLSYSYADNRYTFINFKEYTFPSNFDIRSTISFGTSFTAHNFQLSTGFNWHTGIPSTRPVEGNELVVDRSGATAINYQDANSSRLENYMRVDFSATYNFNISKKVKAHSGISFWNVLNKKNIINNYYQVNNNTVKEIVKEALFLTPNITFRVLF